MEIKLPISPLQFLRPLTQAQINKLEGNWQVFHLQSGKIFPRDQTPDFYQSWKNGNLRLKPNENHHILLKVDINQKSKSYFYYYPIDLDYLFSPDWRKTNITSPYGLFRWAIEMNIALRLNLVEEYEGYKLSQSFCVAKLSSFKKIEEESCNYKNIPLSPEKTLKLNTLLIHLYKYNQLNIYREKKNQLKLAKRAKITNLAQLSAALNTLEFKKGKSWAEKLKYSYTRISTKRTNSLVEELNKNWGEYIGNNQQIKLAEKVGITHLKQLYDILKDLKNNQGISWVKILKYKSIDLQTEKAKTLLKELSSNWKKYIGNNKQISLAEKINITHLKQLFSGLSNFTNSEGVSWAAVLKHKLIDLQIEKAKDLLRELSSSWHEYIGNDQQIKLADKIGIVNLAQLFTALSNLTDETNLAWTHRLKYNKIELAVIKAKTLLKELNSNWKNYVGNDKQIELAEKIDIKRLEQLYTILSNLKDRAGILWVKKLKYNKIKISIKKIRGFFPQLIKFIEENRIPRYLIFDDLKKRNSETCDQRFQQIEKNYRCLTQKIKLITEESWKTSFYNYLVKKLIFEGDEGTAINKLLFFISWIKNNINKINALISSLPIEIDRQFLATVFGDISNIIIAFFGQMNLINRIIRKGFSVHQRLYSDSKIPEDSNAYLATFENEPLSAILKPVSQKKEFEKITRIISNLSPNDQEIIMIIFYENQTWETAANILGIEIETLKENLNRILSRLKSDLEKESGKK